MGARRRIKNVGMGISFTEVEPNQTEILLTWLVAARGS
jgi:hypothetical protein